MLTLAIVSLGLLLAGVFMNTAWYLHLSKLGDRPWLVAALASWGIAFFEYMIQVPTNRLGARSLSVPTLKIMAEAASLLSFVLVSVTLLGHPIDRNYAFAACLSVIAAWIAVARPF